MHQKNNVTTILQEVTILIWKWTVNGFKFKKKDSGVKGGHKDLTKGNSVGNDTRKKEAHKDRRENSRKGLSKKKEHNKKVGRTVKKGTKEDGRRYSRKTEGYKNRREHSREGLSEGK